MTKVEEVAAAMKVARMAKIQRPLSECYDDMAQAAIAAMRNCGENINNVGAQSLIVNMNHPEDNYLGWPDVAELCFASMIDAVLGEAAK